METKIPEFMPTAQDASIPIEGYDDPIEVGSKKTITMDELSDDEKSQLIIKLYKQIKENEVKLDDYIDSNIYELELKILVTKMLKIDPK